MCNYLNFNQVIIILFYCWVVKILYVFLILISYQIYAFQKFPVVTHVAFLFHLLLIFWCTKFCNFDIKQFICFYFCYMCVWRHIQETIVTESNVHGLGNSITLNHICMGLFLNSILLVCVPVFMIVSLCFYHDISIICSDFKKFEIFYLFTHLFILLTILATWSSLRFYMKFKVEFSIYQKPPPLRY